MIVIRGKVILDKKVDLDKRLDFYPKSAQNMAFLSMDEWANLYTY